MQYTFSLATIIAIFFSFAQDANLAAVSKNGSSVFVGFANSSVRFKKELPAGIKLQTEWRISAWKGEKVHTQLLIGAEKDIDKIRLITVDLKDKEGHVIKKDNIVTGFVQYVMTDEFKGACDKRKSTDLDSSLVADIINTNLSSVRLIGNSVQPVWLSIKVPGDAKAGVYAGTITVEADKKYVLDISLNVVDKKLPSPDQYTFELDLWQNPAAIARVHEEVPRRCVDEA